MRTDASFAKAGQACHTARGACLSGDSPSSTATQSCLFAAAQQLSAMVPLVVPNPVAPVCRTTPTTLQAAVMRSSPWTRGVKTQLSLAGQSMPPSAAGEPNTGPCTGDDILASSL